jgi:hypothetical protein
MQWALTAYLLLATTVHPWYISTLVVFSVFTGYRYPVIWSLLVVFSYFAYQTASYQENLFLVAVEYLLVTGVMLYELFRLKKSGLESLFWLTHDFSFKNHSVN